MLFDEDQSRARTGFAAANLSASRQLALNTAKAGQSVKDSMHGKLFRAAVSDEFRLHLLHVHFHA